MAKADGHMLAISNNMARKRCPSEENANVLPSIVLQESGGDH